MKIYYSLLLLLCFGFTFGQASEFTLTAENTSTTFSNPNPESDFTGISAYSLSADAQLYLNYRTKEKEEWSAWKNIPPYTESETPGRQAFEALPLFFSFDSIQFQVEGGNMASVTFRLFQPSGRLPIPEQTSAVSDSIACSCAQPLVCQRNCWCPDGSCPKDTTPTQTTPTHIIIHHSAGFSDYNDYQWVVSYYWDLHVNTNGWDDIGYNWLIDPNGIIYEGRGSGALGAHFSCMNSETTGICMIGNFMTSSPKDTAIRSLEALLAWEACDKQIDPDGYSAHISSQLFLANISSHRDGNNSPAAISCASGTVCPGDSLYMLLPQIRQNVSDKACLQSFSVHEQGNNRFEVYPNPAKAQITLKLEKPDSKTMIHIISFNGQLVKKVWLTEKETTINLEDINSGMYLLKTEDNLFTETLIIR